MNKSLITILAVGAILLSSCSTVRKTATSLDVPTSIMSENVADLKISDERIIYTYKPERAVQRLGEENAIRAAVAEALKANGNADVMVAMQYDIKTSKNFFGRKTINYVTVTGRPGFYTNLHPAEPKQYIILNDGSVITCTNYKLEKSSK